MTFGVLVVVTVPSLPEAGFSTATVISCVPLGVSEVTSGVHVGMMNLPCSEVVCSSQEAVPQKGEHQNFIMLAARKRLPESAE